MLTQGGGGLGKKEGVVFLRRGLIPNAHYDNFKSQILKRGSRKQMSTGGRLVMDICLGVMFIEKKKDF